jgi:uracil-DNA glycosylase
VRRALTHLSSLRQTALLPASWLRVLASEFERPYFHKLEKFIESERKETTVYPREEEVFTAFQLTPFDQVKVVLLGDSPSSVEGEAHGLAFSVRTGNRPSRELVNLFQELRNDLGCWLPNTGCLTSWARQGVLLLNRVLTVRANEPDTHRNRGWETITDACLRALNSRPEPVVFMLWGKVGENVQHLLKGSRHVVLTRPGPGEKGFAGSRPFSAVNNALELAGRSGIYWQLYA